MSIYESTHFGAGQEIDRGHYQWLIQIRDSKALTDSLEGQKAIQQEKADPPRVKEMAPLKSGKRNRIQNL